MHVPKEVRTEAKFQLFLLSFSMVYNGQVYAQLREGAKYGARRRRHHGTHVAKLLFNNLIIVIKLVEF